MSLKLVPFQSLDAVSYSPSIVTMAVSVAVCEIFSVIYINNAAIIKFGSYERSIQVKQCFFVCSPGSVR